MARILFNKRSSAMFDDELEVDELGVETEAEKQMKSILQKQLNTQLSMKEQFSQHRTFVAPSTYKSLTELVEGTCTVQKFKELEKDEELHQELQRCGLTEEEITDYIAHKSGKRNENRLVNPSIWQENISRIEAKIEAHNKELLKPQSFKNVKKLTRHEMEIEKTLYAGCAEKAKLATLVAPEETCDDSYLSGAFSHIKDLSDKLMEKCKRKRKRQKLENKAASASEWPAGNEAADFQYDSNIHHVVVPLEDSEIADNRLSIEEIKEIPRFEKYNMGEPSQTLYIKNLHNKTTAHELRSIFGRFEEENTVPIGYKICTGRMKGQAFISFSDSSVAEKALHLANGFMVRGKPIIIEFGRKT